MYGLSSKIFCVSRDVVFKEDIYPFKHVTADLPPLFPALDIPPSNIAPPNNLVVPVDTSTHSCPLLFRSLILQLCLQLDLLQLWLGNHPELLSLRYV